MINENALAVYKNKPALVKEKSQDKITISLPDNTSIKVREKDIEIIHPGPVKNFSGIENAGTDAFAGIATNSVPEAWELILMEQEKPISLKELAELAFGEYTPASAWAAYQLLLDCLYFSGTAGAILPRAKEKVEADIKKREEKQKTGKEREEFLQRLKKRTPNLSSGTLKNSDMQKNTDAHTDHTDENHSDDRRFIQDVEALALGKSTKSRTLKEIGLSETPEDAHALLLECGFWTEKNNPHPGRSNISLAQAKNIPDPPPPENRKDLTHLAAFAIDSPWSSDPDDAVSLETEGSCRLLYVHVADPAASVGANSPVEQEARDRGATLYIPEGNFRMLAEEALPIFALGIAPSADGQANASGDFPPATSPALTFKITLDNAGEIMETDIFPSVVKVQRLTYEEADKLIAVADGANRTSGVSGTVNSADSGSSLQNAGSADRTSGVSGVANNASSADSASEAESSKCEEHAVSAENSKCKEAADSSDNADSVSNESDSINCAKSASSLENTTNEELAKAAILRSLFVLAERNLRRRTAAGAISIEMPETHMSLDNEQITINPIPLHRSSMLVRECMLLAGEGAGTWATQRKLCIPFVGQETGEIPSAILPGLAGSYQLRRCMRPRTLATSPSSHTGLGLKIYAQVTSPLRRYTDLLTHIQIRSLLRGDAPLSGDEVSARMNAAEASANAVTQAERSSRSHWTMVYLSSKKDSVWDAIALEKKGNRWAVIIPALALETQVSVRSTIAPNVPLKLILKAISIPKGEAVFIPEE